jgi:hypothetical protein
LTLAFLKTFRLTLLSFFYFFLPKFREETGLSREPFVSLWFTWIFFWKRGFLTPPSTAGNKKSVKRYGSWKAFFVDEERRGGVAAVASRHRPGTERSPAFFWRGEVERRDVCV